MHLGLLPRRQEFRRAREDLIGARGWLTLAGERLHGLVGEAEDWPSLLPVRPDQVIPGTRFLLIDRQSACCYPLRTGLNTLGRLPNNDIVFQENLISRRHCAVLVHAWGGAELHDLASRNGTFVNGRRVTRPASLTSGDTIRVYDRPLLFVSEKDYHQAGDPDDDHPATLPG
jgi:hypothetical protein